MKTFWQIYDWSALFSMEGCVPVPTLASLLPRLRGPNWHGPPLFPASSYSPRHQTTTSGNVSHPFSVSLLTVCPLPLICTGMNNPVLEDYSNFTIIFMMQRLGGSFAQPSCIVLSTPTGISGGKTTGQAEQNIQNIVLKSQIHSRKAVNFDCWQREPKTKRNGSDEGWKVTDW